MAEENGLKVGETTANECFNLLSVMLMLFRLTGNGEGSRIEKWTSIFDRGDGQNASPTSVKVSQEESPRRYKDGAQSGIDIPKSNGTADFFAATVSLLCVGFCFMLLARLFNVIFHGRISMCESKHFCDSLSYVIVDM